MTDYYIQELRPTGIKDEYTMVYLKKTLTAAQEAEIADLKVLNESNETREVY